jgi:hypothetical protein
MWTRVSLRWNNQIDGLLKRWIAEKKRSAIWRERKIAAS